MFTAEINNFKSNFRPIIVNMPKIYSEITIIFLLRALIYIYWV